MRAFAKFKTPAILTLAAFGLVMLPGSASAGPKERRAAMKAQYKPTGETVDCVQIRNIQNTRVLDDRTIDFVMNNRQVYRNTLPNSCPSLAFEERFMYKTSLSQLCSVDIITVLQQWGGGLAPGASCGLGKFEKTTKVGK